MLTEDEYLEIEEACIMSIDAVDDAILLCNHFPQIKKKIQNNLKRVRVKLVEVVDLCKGKTDMEPSRTPHAIAKKINKDAFINVIRYKYDIEDSLDSDSIEDQEEHDELLAYELFGSITYAAMEELRYPIDCFADDDKVIVNRLESIVDSITNGIWE